MRKLRRPLVSLLLLILIAADVVWVFRAYTWSGARNSATTSLIPYWISKHVFGIKVPDFDFAYPWTSTFVKEGDAYRDLDTTRSSADELTKLLAGRAQDVVEVKRTRFVGRRGWWAPTAALTEHRLRITRMSDGSGQDGDLAVREAYAESWFGKKDPERERLKTGDVLKRRILWSGYVHNAAILIAAALFAISLGWLPRLYGAGRRRRLLARSICPSCGYDLSGTAVVEDAKTCPECGRKWGTEGSSE